ncbi:hypothetical protein RDABS01_018412 [Bienertia sinuspersici]
MLVSNTCSRKYSGVLVVESCNAIDKEALVEFKREVKNPFPWQQTLPTWVPTTDCCAKWRGVTCDPATGRVVGIELVGYFDESGLDPWFGQLQGTLSPFLGNLTYLRVLNLKAQASLSGPIPPELAGSIPLDIGKLRGLKHIDLSYNHICGIIPYSIGNNLSQLQALFLNHNNLSGTIPDSIGNNLSQLQVFFLDHNNLRGSIPTSIGNLRALRYLHLDHNQLIGVIPNTIGKISLLQNLYLNYNRLSGPIPSSIYDLNLLNILNLGHNNLTGTIPSNLLTNNKLQVFDVSGNQLSGKIPPHNSSRFQASAFSQNAGLCGAPLLLPCKPF